MGGNRLEWCVFFFNLRFKNSSTTNGFNEIKGGFDEEAAAVMLGRLGVFKVNFFLFCFTCVEKSDQK